MAKANAISFNNNENKTTTKMKIKALLISFCFFSIMYAQIPKGFFMGKVWSKEISLYKAKAFVINNVLDSVNNVIKFQISPLAASNSGELTTLVYDCRQQNKTGLVLVFYGDYWNESGVSYQGYNFKKIEKIKAIAVLERLSKTINENYKFLNEDKDDFNLTYKDDDMKFLIYNVSFNSTKIRVFWNGFDAEWDASSLYKTLEKLKK